MSQSLDTRAGQAVYTPLMLAFYDAIVFGFNNPVVWRCPTRKLLAHYDAHVSERHLDVGVGTGYFLDRCAFPTSQPELTLFDLNPNSLAACERRLRRYRPRTHQGDVMEPDQHPAGRYGSVGLSYLLHCLPGDLRYKSRALHHLGGLLRPGGVIFGSTILNGGVPHTALSRRVMASFNQRGIFGNLRDDLDTLHQVLAAFSKYDVTVIGSVALFAAWP